MEENKDIWTRLYEAAKKEYAPDELTPFVCARHVVSAIEAEDGQIFTGFCIEGLCGTMNLCAERTALLNMYMQSGQTRAKRVITFRDRPPYGEGSGMPCGVCREFFYQLNEENGDTEFLMDYDTRQTITLKELQPVWWGAERNRQ